MLRSKAVDRLRLSDPMSSRAVAGVDLVNESRRRTGWTSERRPFRVFTPALAILLCGYLFFNRAFAYLHIPGTPIFIGEIVLGIGVIEALMLRPPWLRITARSPILKALVAFAALCFARMLFDLPTYGIDAIRDSAVWYYGAFAFLTTAAVIYDPTFTPRMLRWYRRIIPLYFLWTPFAIILARIDALTSITIPDSSTPINSFRVGDAAVHTAMALAYLWLGVNRMAAEPPHRRSELALGVLALLTLLMAGTQNRGGLAAAILMMAIVVMFLPTVRRRSVLVPVTACLLLVVVVMLLIDLRIPTAERDVSLQQLAQNFVSVAERDDSSLSDTIEWRERLWTETVDDVTESQVWLAGFGFGPILAERYDVVDTSDPQPLRSVHNSHLTIMARTGGPGFVLWLALWTVWAVHLVRFIRRRGGLSDASAALAAWLLGASAAFMVNAFFDPALEGPHVAIWLYVLVGVAAGHTIFQAPTSDVSPANLHWTGMRVMPSHPRR